jgi:hypothetical protein
MNVCISELLKTVKKLEEKVSQLKSLRNENATYSYIKDEKPIIPELNPKEITKQIAELQDKIIYLRNKIAYLNSTVEVDGFETTLGGCIVMLGQCKGELQVINILANKPSISRRTVYNGDVEYTEVNYDINYFKELYDTTNDKISRLQMTIDRYNLNTMFDIDTYYLQY